MPDVIHFDADQALDKILSVFWRQGYKATTTKELAASADLSEGSLFNTFGSKREVYMRSLERYREISRKMKRMLDREDSALTGIRDFWNFICNYAADPKSNGCFLTNATIEHADDLDVKKILTASHKESERAFKATLDRAIDLGELAEGTDTQALAQYLQHSAQGIRVLARTKPSKAQMKNIARLTLSVLDPYRTI